MIFPLRWMALVLAVVSFRAVAHAAVPVIAIADWPTAAQKGGDPFSYQIKASDSPSSYDAVGLPAGLTLNRTTGQISGTLPTPASTTFTDITLQATNASGTASARVTLFIQIPPRFVPPSNGWSQTAMANLDYSFRPQWTGGSPTWPGFRASGVPAGLSFEPATGAITGKPTVPGIYSITLTVTNETGSDTATLALTIVNDPPGPPVIQNTDLAADHFISDRGREPSGYYKRIRISATNFPTSFAYASSLRATSFEPTTGTLEFNINDTPAGLHAITLSATNSKGTGSKTIQWPVHPRVIDINFVADAPYYVGDTITVRAKFNSPVIITGTPAVAVSPRHRVEYISGSGTDTLTFTRRTSADDYLAGRLEIPNQIDLNGGTIAHPSGPAAVLSADVPRLQTWSRSHEGVYLPAPVINSNATASGDVGRSFQFAVTATNRPTGFALRTGSLPAGLSLNPTTGLIFGTPTQAGTYALSVVATSPAPPFGSGLITSAPASLAITIAPAGAAPETTASRGGIVAGNNPVVPGNTVAPAVPPSGPAPASRLANLSARLHVSDDDPQRSFITGFVIAGTQPQRVLIRASGPALSAFGVQGVLGNPRLQLFDTSGRIVAENDDWSGAETRSAGEELGAFALRGDSADAAILVTLSPGSYTARVLANGGSGVALAEIYDAATAPTNPTRPPLVNLSTRGFVGTGENALSVGFVIAGDTPKSVLIRGLGPALIAFGLIGLADPLVTLQQGPATLATNDDWHVPASPNSSSAVELSAAATATGAFPLVTGSKDAALLVTLAPGAYTASVRGAADSTGLALVEVYELAAPAP